MVLEVPGSIPARSEKKLVSSLHIICRDDMNKVHCPLDWDVNWRPSVLGQSSPVQVKDPYKHRSVLNCTSPKNNQKLIDGSNKTRGPMVL